MPERRNIATAESTPHAFSARWEAVRSSLHQETGDNNFRSWIQPISFQSFGNGVLNLGVPTRFMRDWIRTHYEPRIRSLWLQNGSGLNHIEISVAAAPAVTLPSAGMILPSAPSLAANDAVVDGEGTAADFSSPLDPRYTFDNFVVAPSNALAATAARRVAESDSILFNPLYVYGAVGLGKTHLLQASVAALRARNLGAKAIYMSAERFMYHFVQALRRKDTMAFKARFRAIDILVIDDIQFICGKEATQDEFLSTFNALLDEGKQIVVAADRSPAELDGVSERLRSRLGGGLAVRIEPAAYPLRLSILQLKRDLLKRDIPDEVLAFLAAGITTNVRELEGGLNRLVAQAELMGRAVNIETAQDLLQDLLRAGVRRLSIEDIQKKVTEHYDIRMSDMLSPRRARTVARPRQVAMYLAKVLTEHSLPDIGRKFGGRDHTTIIHGIRRIEALMTSDPAIAQDVAVLKRALAA